MKKYILFLLFVISSNILHAQPDSANRLIAQSNYIYSEISLAYDFDDSTSYKYLGKNGYSGFDNFNSYEWNFTERLYLDFDASKKLTYQDKVVSMRDTLPNNLIVNKYTYLDSTSNTSFDTLNLQIDSIKNDRVTSKSYYSYINSAWVIGQKIEYYWNQNKKIDSFYVFRWGAAIGAWVPTGGNVFIYQGSDLINKYVLQYNNTTKVYDTTYKNYYVYNVGGLLVEEYNEVKFGTQNVFTPNTRKTYTYYSNGNLDTTRNYTWSLSVSLWQLRGMESRTYNSIRKLANLLRKAGNGVLFNSDSIMYEYNADSLLIKEDTRKWSGGIYKDYHVKNYYYEKYSLVDAPNFIKTVTKQGGILDVYPIPSSNSINLNINTGETVDMLIYNSAGNIVKVESIRTNGTNTNRRTVDVSDLPNGNYLIQIRNKNMSATKRFNILR